MENKPIINQRYSLDLGSSSPVEVIVREVDEKYVYVEYLYSWEGRTEKFTLSDWNHFV